MSHANQPEIRYLYTKTGQVDTMWYPRINTKTAYKYNHRKWLDTLIATRGANDIFREYLTFDPTGQITKQNSKQGTGSWLPQNYEYDVLGQLTRWLHDSGTGSQAGEDYTYDSVGNRLNLYFENNTGTITSWRNYDIGRRTDTNAGPNQMLKGTNRNFFTIFDYTTYTYDPDGSQSRRKLYTGAGLQLDEQFEYSSWRGLSSKYTRTDPNLLSGSDTWEYRYRYNAMGEREQKRETLNPAGDGTAANGYSWSYYLLGGSREQLSLWEGLQTSDATFCSPPGAGSYVNLYPTEYLVYGVEYPGVKEDVPRLRLLPNNTQEYRITDHLATVRSTLNNSGTVTNTYDYEPFGDILSGGGEARQGFNSREKDQEVDLFNNGVRKLDDNEGRFTSIDPLWEKFRSWSPYQYGDNNPVRMTDPTGFQAAPVAGPDMPSPLGLNKHEMALARDNPRSALSVFSNAETASEVAEERAGRLGGGVVNGPADAFRHAFWSAMNARDVGPALAREFGTLHEMGEDLDPAESEMDLHNNEVGIQIGFSYPDASDEELADIVESVLKNCGLLQTSPTHESYENLNSTSDLQPLKPSEINN